MKMKFVVAALLAAVLCVGCGQDESKTSQAPKSAPPSSQEAQDQVFSQEAMDKIHEVAGPMFDEAKEASKELAVKAKQRTEEFAVALQEESVPAMKKTGEALVVAGEKVQKAAEVLSASEKVVLANKKGKVIFFHRRHGKAHGCKACHAEKTPGPLKLEKVQAHTLCKGCHKEQGHGPTNCLGCHEKKQEAAVEGC